MLILDKDKNRISRYLVKFTKKQKRELYTDKTKLLKSDRKNTDNKEENYVCLTK